VLQKRGGDERKTFGEPRGYRTEHAATQIESFGLKPSLERRNCFQIYHFRCVEGNIIYNPVLFVFFYLADSEFSPVKNIWCSVNSNTNFL